MRESTTSQPKTQPASASPYFSRGGIIRASKRHPCPVCGGMGWPCYAKANGELAGCGKVVSDRQDRDGVNLHILGGSPTPAVRIVKRRPLTETVHPPAQALADRLHTAYSALLELLPLSEERRGRLLARGLTVEAIQRAQYRDTPRRAQAEEIARTLAPLGLEGVPGFYARGVRAQMVRCFEGTFTPYRDREGRIRGLAYRLDVPLRGLKYMWFSSDPEKTFDDGTRKYPGGAKLTPPLHLARPELLPLADEILLTEGALKADVISLLLGAPVLAAGGVTVWGRNFGANFAQAFPGKRAVLTFDADWRSNEQVRRALEKLMDDLDGAGVPFTVRTWPGTAKGFDDYLLSQIPSQEVAA
jgi:hypothetical protein